MQKLKILIILIIFHGECVCAAGQNDKCYRIDNLEIQDAYNISNFQIRKLKKKYENICLSVEDLKDIIRMITNLYIEDGYITTRAYIPEQNLNEGKLIIKVHEGVVEDIESARISRNLPIKKDRILNLRDLEQTIDILGGAGSSKVHISLKPGKADGSSIIVIDNKPSKKWHISTGIDNAGTKNKGRNQSFSNFAIGDILGLHEYYNFSYRISTGDCSKNFMRSYNASVSLPYGYNNFTLQYNDTLYRTFIRTVRNKYSNKGGSKIAKFSIDRTMHRDSGSKTNLTGGIGYDDYSNYIADNKIEISTYRMHKADIGLRHQRRLQSSGVSFGLQYTYGENQNYKTNLANLAVPRKLFHKFNYNISWQKPLPIIIGTKNINYNLLMLGQYSPLMLVISEKNSLGGLSSVRGFKDYIENADSTIVLRNEVTIGMPFVSIKIANMLFGDMSVFTAFDWGKFVNHEEKGTRSGILSGIACGMRNANGYINFAATIARPLKAPIKTDESTVMYLSLSVDI